MRWVCVNDVNDKGEDVCAMELGNVNSTRFVLKRRGNASSPSAAFLPRAFGDRVLYNEVYGAKTIDGGLPIMRRMGI